MNVLSLFDGISCGKVALDRAMIKVDNYFSSEIKEKAIKCSMFNHKDIIYLGDVRNIKSSDLPKIDLLIGGSPCQDFSFLKDINGNGEGLNGNKSRLFYEYLRLLNELKPKYFLLENVKMKKKYENQINDYLGVEGLHINSNLFSFQNRPRIYWTNIEGIKKIEDREINFQDYKEKDKKICSFYKLNKTPSRIKMWNNGKGYSGLGTCNNITNSNKIGCVTRKQDRSPNSGLIEFDDFCRYLTRREIEEAQNLPIGYTDCLTYNQMQDVCGDCWTVDVISHIFSKMNVEKNKEYYEASVKRLEDHKKQLTLF